MKMQFSPLPSLPVGLKNGVGFADGDVIYAGLGSLGEQWLMLDVASGLNWQAKAPFPGTCRNDAVCIPVNRGCYVFSGAGVAHDRQYPTVLLDGYFYDCQHDRWQLVTDQIPVGLLGAAGCAIGDNLFLIGGYNKDQFDGLMQQLNDPLTDEYPEKRQACLAEFMSKPVEDYHWNDKIYRFDLCQQQWSVAADNPFQSNCGAGVFRSGDSLTLVEGEVKPGLRSLHSKQYLFSGGRLVEATYLPSIIESDAVHEGLAGAYCGEINGLWIVAGGAFFIGSQNNYRTEMYYSHQGLSKTFSNTVWCFDGCEWQLAGILPQGRAYGVGVTTSQGMVIIGGESQQGDALTQCYLLS